MEDNGMEDRDITVEEQRAYNHESRKRGNDS